MKGFDYTIKNKPTRYNGIQFRSRLEAKWAAFFDLLNWKWEYEPCDFDGWIPDFVIVGREELIFVEVKPIYPFHNYDETVDRIMKNIENCNCKGTILLAGISLFDNGLGYHEPDSEISLGMIYAPDSLEVDDLDVWKKEQDPSFKGRRDACLDRNSRSWDRAMFGLWEGIGESQPGYNNWNNTYGIFIREKTSRDLITDCHDLGMDCEETFYGDFFAPHKVRIQQLWKQATNIVQWNNYGDSSITSIVPSDNTNKIPSRA
jgi:hypothetical protein